MSPEWTFTEHFRPRTRSFFLRKTFKQKNYKGVNYPYSVISVHSVILYFWVRKNAECRISCIWLKSLLNSASNEPGVSLNSSRDSEISIRQWDENFLTKKVFKHFLAEIFGPCSEVRISARRTSLMSAYPLPDAESNKLSIHTYFYSL